MSQHTKAFRVIDDPNVCTMICEDAEDGAILARMEVYSSDDPDFNDDVQLANARLWAAAPDLLAACKAARRSCNLAESTTLAKILDLAIGKAEGGPPCPTT